jgi:hypothetical protein
LFSPAASHRRAFIFNGAHSHHVSVTFSKKERFIYCVIIHSARWAVTLLCARAHGPIKLLVFSIFLSLLARLSEPFYFRFITVKRRLPSADKFNIISIC